MTHPFHYLKAPLFKFVFCFCLLTGSSSFAEDKAPAIPSQNSAPLSEKQISPAQLSSIPSAASEGLVQQVREAASKYDLARVTEIVNQCRQLYGEEAKKQQGLLTGFPTRGEESKYQALNDVAVCLFVRGEMLMDSGMPEEARVQFQEIIDDFSWAQAWDPSRGGFWSIAEKSQASIDVITGKTEEELEKQTAKVVRTKPILATPGKSNIVDYTKYGKFHSVGTQDYSYEITDMKGLAEAVGEGIYPNVNSVYINPRYRIVRSEGRLKGKHWDFVNSDDLEAAYFKWNSAPESPGLKLFYIALFFEKAGMYYEALKAYHALVVHFPKTAAWTYWQTPWYPGQAAIAKIRFILRSHPELNLNEQWMKIEVKNSYDNNIENDVISTYPGKIFELNPIDKFKQRFDDGKVALKKIKKRVGNGAVRLVQYDNGHWQLMVHNKPYIIKGISYAPTKVGQSPDKGTLKNWMDEDNNHNGLADGPFDSWVDKNRNNEQDPDEPVVGDFRLLKEMGVNTIRVYHHPSKPNKELLRKLFKDYGIRVIMGDYIGKYTLVSGATWFDGTDYENPEHRKTMMAEIKKMVMDFKDEPYILMWLLGNENNYGVASNADKKPVAFYQFADEVAEWIKSVDKNHPVVVSNGDTLFLDIFAQYAPHIDIFAANVYRGDYGFGSFWEQVFDASGKPAFISEYGCPAYARHLSLGEAEEAQSQYHRGNWMDIEENSAGHRGIGNSLGGVVFEWMDEWWKNYEPYLHDRKADAAGPFPGGYYFEEWFGVTSQGNGKHSPFMRQLRKSYFAYKELWNKAQ